MSHYINNIPKHWQVVKVSEIGELIRGVNYKKEESTTSLIENYLPILRGNNINGELNFDNLVYVNKKNISFVQLLQKGDIVFAMSSGSKHLVGKSAKVKKDFHGSFGAFCGVFRAYDRVNKNFVAYFFQSPYYKKVISEISKGTNINNLKRDHILDLDIPLPPLTEQQAIVAKIEELLSDLENGKQQLLTAQQQLKVYRQSLLKAAFEGKLTNQDVKDGELPKGWYFYSLKELKQFSIYGPRFSSKDYTKNGVAVLRTSDISERGKVDWVNSPKLELSSKEFEKYKLIKNDLLITRTGSIGRLSVFNDDKKAIPGAFLIHYRLKDDINIWYIFHFLKTQTAQKHFKDHSFGVGRPNLNVPNIELLKIPIPSITEQQMIVDVIESKLTVCDKIVETITQSLQQAETLKQSILKRAFEGKLINF